MDLKETLDKFSKALETSKRELGLMEHSRDWIAKAGYAQKVLAAQHEALQANFEIMAVALSTAEVDSAQNAN